MKFLKIKAGKFKMGSPKNDLNRFSDETLHNVELTEDFEMMDAPVTQSEWQEVMWDNPSYFKDNPNNPVEQVSWNDCQKFIKKLNEKNDGYVYRLPTEAEWEYCSKSCDKIPLNDQAWYYENSNNKTHPVKQKQPNKLGLYDMLGNVWEWVQDFYGAYDDEEE
jgi:formylglycine-generating enzyme required for sulfatase activity